MLAFCIFKNNFYVSSNKHGDHIFELKEKKLEIELFKFLEPFVGDYKKIIGTSGPAPFTKLRILRSVQLGLALGIKAKTPMVSMFDILQSAVKNIDEYIILLDTKRGDYFGRYVKENKIIEERIYTDVAKNLAIVSDNLNINTIEIKANLAKVMIKCKNTTNQLNYMINPIYSQ